MSKKKASLHVQTDLSNLFSNPPSQKNTDGYPIEKALAAILRQMNAAGMRKRTISDYQLHVEHFAKITGATVIEELTTDHIYRWLSSMDVSNSTKLIRLKCLKAFLSRCFKNGWITTNFWADIKIKVDQPVKEGATDREINLLLSLLDLTKFVELRDAAAVLLMYQTGVRIGTLSQLEQKHVDLESKLLRIDGGIIKNHEAIYLPFDDVLARILAALMKQNDLIRSDSKINNDLLFITINGSMITNSPTNNNITKRLCKYSRDYSLKNINPHALRRGFAKNLLHKGADVALISKALGHSDLAVTTRYLHLSKDEVVDSLRKYL
ncbi:tyrosine-type recombinase/integrase [Neobacillus vireti]|uniref:Integrase/recombinase n=1 Tax=Neobacillus vireti LMG 21834 TaxID=1131730 RepID=A0AB94ILB5_9BACI|nr:site-specific integrase [Neobacillus vireti]ETI67855.1 integrase/recombinase [Neobacillus vireti LMG 21834]KLT16133.1 integrase [Neobacillus vireti]